MISVEGVTKRFGPLVAVDDVSFGIERGEVVGFLGPNGAGKTTTMRMLTGTLEPDAGVIGYEGDSISDHLIEAKRRIGFLPESNPLYDDMIVCEYLEHVAALRELDGGTTRSAIRDAVDQTDLGAVFFRPIAELSKGYRQRIGLAAAILPRPEILVLDEPTEGLDPNQRVEIRKLVSNLGKDRTVILSTHVMQEVEATCDRILIIARGKLVADGPVSEILADREGATYTIVEAQGSGVVEALAALPGVSSHEYEDREGRVRVRLTSQGEAELRPRIFALAKESGWMLWELHQERATLEEVFRDLTADRVEEEGNEAPASPEGAPASEAADS